MGSPGWEEKNLFSRKFFDNEKKTNIFSFSQNACPKLSPPPMGAPNSKNPGSNPKNSYFYTTFCKYRGRIGYEINERKLKSAGRLKCSTSVPVHEPPRQARSRNPCILKISEKKPTQKVHVPTTVTFCVFNIFISSFFSRQGTYVRFVDFRAIW